MRKLLNKPWFVATAALAAIALVVNSVFFPNGTKFRIRGLSGESTDGEAAAGVEARATAWSVVRKIPIPVNLRDPFAVKLKPAEIVEKAPEPDAVDTLHLSAIWTQDGRTLALINDRICESGDQIGRLKFESATREGVWVSHWKGRDFVKLGSDFTLNTPAAQLAQMLGSL